MDKSGSEMVREGDNEETLMKPLFIPIKVEPDFQRMSEETVMEENFKEPENIQNLVSTEYALKRDTDNADVLMEPLGCIKTELDLERTTEESFLEVFKTSKIAEEFSLEICQRTPTNNSATSCSLEKASSTAQSPPVEEMGMIDQKYFSEFSCSSEHRNMLVEGSLYQKSLAVESCSTETVRVEQKQYFDQRESESFAKHEGTCLEREVQESVSLKSSFEGSDTECSGDERTFTQKPTFVAYTGKHSDDGKVECIQCGTVFKSKSSLNRHSLIHTGERLFKCNLCGKAYKNKGDLNRHMRTHTGERKFMCSHCGKTFSQSYSLSLHMNIHTGSRPFKCSQCEKSFSDSSILSHHMRIHTGEKPFECSQCGKAFSRNTILTRHMRIHTGKKPFKCSQCDKSFTQRGTLTIHMRVHTGERPFACSLCGKQFITSSNLSAHKCHVHTDAASAS